MNKVIITQIKKATLALIVASCAFTPLSPAFGQAKSASSSKASSAPSSSAATTSRSGFSSPVQRGVAEHTKFKQEMQNTGRRTDVRTYDLKRHQGGHPDAVTKSDRPVELKPDTTSGRNAMRSQLGRYESTMQKRGIGVYYDPQTGSRRIERTPYSEWRNRPENRPEARRIRIAP